MRKIRTIIVLALFLFTWNESGFTIFATQLSNEVVINEIAWMGTTNNYCDEWIELYNNTDSDIDLEGWTLNSKDGSPSIELAGEIPANGYFLLEKQDDNSVPDINADLIYSGALSNKEEVLELRNSNGVLIDIVDDWYAGSNDTKATMERVNTLESGIEFSNWANAVNSYNVGFGTPKELNTNSNDTNNNNSGSTDNPEDSNEDDDTTEHINNVSDESGSINVYFNKSALTKYATSDNKANYNVNLENRLLERINNAETSIDMATYEINLPKIVDALINKAAGGVDVRVLADAKDSTDPHYIERYKIMKLNIEKLVRGKDGEIGTNDDIYVFSDSPMFAVEDETLRVNFGLPAEIDDIDLVTVKVGSSPESGYLFADAEKKLEGVYYPPNDQMHNKFVIVDDTWVWTGSWNFTITGLYGSEDNMENGILDGNQQHSIEINSSKLANIYATEFNEMWGSNELDPNPEDADLHSRKSDNTKHTVNVDGKTIEVYFSPGDNALGRMNELIKNEADYNTYFSIFTWSDQSLVDELKYKWENSYDDLEGTLTGFDIKGVFDSDYWNQWWSATVDMTGRSASRTSKNNPNIRWANLAPVYKDAETRKLHSKTMLIDVDTNSDPTVIIGSTNWSNNGNNVNDENMIIIHDEDIANQFAQEFYARYKAAGGQLLK